MKKATWCLTLLILAFAVFYGRAAKCQFTCGGNPNIQLSNYTASFGNYSWAASLNYLPNDSEGESAYVVPEIHLPSTMENDIGSSLKEAFIFHGTGLDCSTLNAQVQIKGTVPGFSDYRSDPWTSVTAVLDGSSTANQCVYSYEVPISQVRTLFDAAAVKHSPDTGPSANPWQDYYLAVTISGDQDCARWFNRYYVAISENFPSKDPYGLSSQWPVPPSVNYDERAWNSDFQVP
jgi:hypothetical protein